MSQPQREDTVEVYHRTDDLWEWRRKAANGQVVATSGGQGYTTRYDARMAAARENPGMVVTVTEEGQP